MNFEMKMLDFFNVFSKIIAQLLFTLHADILSCEISMEVRGQALGDSKNILVVF